MLAGAVTSPNFALMFAVNAARSRRARAVCCASRRRLPGVLRTTAERGVGHRGRGLQGAADEAAAEVPGNTGYREPAVPGRARLTTVGGALAPREAFSLGANSPGPPANKGRRAAGGVRAPAGKQGLRRAAGGPPGNRGYGGPPTRGPGREGRMTRAEWRLVVPKPVPIRVARELIRVALEKEQAAAQK